MKRNETRTFGAAKFAFNGLARNLSEQLKASILGGLIVGYLPSESYAQQLSHAITDLAANNRWQEACTVVELVSKKLCNEQLDFLREGRKLLAEEVSKMMSKTASFPEWRHIADDAKKIMTPFADQFNGRIPNVEDAALLYNEARPAVEKAARELQHLIDVQGPEVLRKRNREAILSEFSDVLKDLDVMIAASAEAEQPDEQREKVA